MEVGAAEAEVGGSEGEWVRGLGGNGQVRGRQVLTARSLGESRVGEQSGNGRRKKLSTDRTPARALKEPGQREEGRSGRGRLDEIWGGRESVRVARETCGRDSDGSTWRRRGRCMRVKERPQQRPCRRRRQRATTGDGHGECSWSTGAVNGEAAADGSGHANGGWRGLAAQRRCSEASVRAVTSHQGGQLGRAWAAPSGGENCERGLGTTHRTAREQLESIRYERIQHRRQRKGRLETVLQLESRREWWVG